MAETYTTKLIENATVAEGTMLFRFEKPAGFAYRAGQTIDLSLPPQADTAPLKHTFSLVTTPTEETLAIATRMRGSDYKNTLKDLPAGAELKLEGPYGSFLLHADENRPAVFLVGGIGITPFMSMIKDAKDRALPHQLFLFYSNRRPQDAAFLDELTALAEASSTLTFVPTMTDLEGTGNSWSGETGYITWEMVQRHLPAGNPPVFYMAGPAAMVGAMRTLLTEHGVSEDDMRFEEFAGY